MKITILYECVIYILKIIKYFDFPIYDVFTQGRHQPAATGVRGQTQNYGAESRGREEA